MGYRLTGFNDHGEVRIVNDDDLLVACGELRLEDAYSDLDRGDLFNLEVRITWTRDELDDVIG